jgi:hypothetical protein
MCTGTHFARFILDQSEFFYYGIPEQLEFPNGKALQFYFHKMLTKCCKKVEFYKKLTEMMLQEDWLRKRKKQIKYYGGNSDDKDLKKIKYILFQTHSNYLTRMDTFLFPFHSFIVPVRHPILSIISILRRHKGSLGEIQTDKIIFEWIHCARTIWSKDFPMYVFINPWQVKGFGRLFKRLNIRQNEMTRRFVHKHPVVNKTYKEDEVPENAQLYAVDKTNEEELVDAKECFIRESKITKPIEKYNEMLIESQLLDIYNNLCFNNQAEATPNG